MSEYKGRPVFGELVCQRCGATVNGMWWASFTVNGDNIGNICENCRCQAMAEYIIPCGYRAHGDEWHHTGSAKSIGERLRRAVSRLRREDAQSAVAVDPQV